MAIDAATLRRRISYLVEAQPGTATPDDPGDPLTWSTPKLVDLLIYHQTFWRKMSRLVERKVRDLDAWDEYHLNHVDHRKHWSADHPDRLKITYARKRAWEHSSNSAQSISEILAELTANRDLDARFASAPIFERDDIWLVAIKRWANPDTRAADDQAADDEDHQRATDQSKICRESGNYIGPTTTLTDD